MTPSTTAAPGACFQTTTLQAFMTGTWGACVGVYLTALVLAVGVLSSSDRASTFHPAISPIQIYKSSATIPWQETYERRMYLLQCVLCPILAWLALRFTPRRNGWACLVAFVLFVPVITVAYRGLYLGEPQGWAYFLTALALVVPCWRWNQQASAMDTRPTTRSDSAAASSSCLDRQALVLGLVLMVLLVLFCFPFGVNKFADTMADNIHVCTWAVGPALYYYSPDMVPGLDFESHYGLGHTYLFSHFLGTSLHQTLVHYVWFLFMILTFYTLSAYFVLTNLFQSARAALLATAILTVLSMEGQSYGYPSNWPVRFPFLFIFIGCAAQETLFHRSWLPVVMAGLFAGASLFWQTDGGLFMGLTGAAYYTVLTLSDRASWSRVLLFVLSAGCAFVALASLVVGPLALLPSFYQRLFEPLFLYGTGFGFILMHWQAGWSYLYNVIGPVITLASVGWGMYQFRSKHREMRLVGRYLFLCGVVGSLMLLKWVNRSLDILWSLNGIALVVVLFWWARYAILTGWRHLKPLASFYPRWGFGLSARSLAAISGCICVLALAIVDIAIHRQNDPPGASLSPLVRLSQFTAETPTPVNGVARSLGAAPALPLARFQTTGADVAFLRAQTDDKEPVALISLNDWLILTEARRAPRFPLLPAFYVYSNNLVEKIENNVRRTNRLFVERDHLEVLQKVNEALYDRVMPILEREFTLVGSSKNLDLYQRKASSLIAENRHP